MADKTIQPVHVSGDGTNTAQSASGTGTNTAASQYDPSLQSVYNPVTSSATSGLPAPAPVSNVTAPSYQAAQGTAQNANTTQANTTATTAQNGNATNWNVDDKQTVAGQVKGIIANNSPLMQQAVTQANEAANGKGLLNSSMAVTAGQSALYSAALPIAQADAATNAEAGKTNAGAANTQSLTNQQAQNQATAATAAAQNQTSQFNANASNSTSQFNASQGNAMSAQNAQAQNDASKSNQAASLQSSLANQSTQLSQASQAYDSAVKSAMQTADTNSKIQLAAIDSATKQTLMSLQAKYNVQMQTSQSMATTYSQLLTQITGVMTDKDMDASSKQTAINNLTQLYNNALQMQSSLSGLDLGTLLGGLQGNQNAAAPPPSGPPVYNGAPNTNTGGDGQPNTGTNLPGGAYPADSAHG